MPAPHPRETRDRIFIRQDRSDMSHFDKSGARSQAEIHSAINSSSGNRSEFAFPVPNAGERQTLCLLTNLARTRSLLMAGAFG